MRVVRAVGVGMWLWLGATHTVAVEPDIPRQLISSQQAVAFRIAIAAAADRPGLAEVERRERRAIATFYSKTGSGLQWVDQGGLRLRAKTIVAEIRNADSWGLRARDFDVADLTIAEGSANSWDLSRQITAELKVALAALKYARHARGGRLQPGRLSLDFDRQPLVLAPGQVLGALIASDDPAAYLRGLHPRHLQFRRLRTVYAAALAGGAQLDVIKAPAGRSKRRKRRRVKVPSRQRQLERIRFNMEMWRWMPAELGDKFVWANIPEFKVRVVAHNAVVHQERMIVGKPRHKTPIFSDEMETIVFQPYWAVPNSIKVKELLPKLLRGGSLRGLKISTSVGGRAVDPYMVDWQQTDIRKYIVYQPPGRRNALGKVKFLFPNRHAIYFHDTPSKNLFRHSRRAFSHGCMRVRNPLQLAKVLLGADRGWQLGEIKHLSSRGPANNEIHLKQKIPVHVTYFTAAVDGRGRVRFFNDLYGHERLIRLGLAGRTKLLKEPVAEDLTKVREQVIAAAGGQRRGLHRAGRSLPVSAPLFMLGNPPAVARVGRVRESRRRYAQRWFRRPQGWRHRIYSNDHR